MDRVTARSTQGPKHKKNTSQQLLVWQWNPNGIQGKKASLQQYIQQCNTRPDIIVIQETHSETPPSLPGYRSFAKPPSDRTVGKGAGQGVCTFVKKNLTAIDHELLPRGAIEHVTVEIVTGRGKQRRSVFVINIYSNPKHHQQKFRTLLHKTQQLTGPGAALVCGDFNAQHTAWGYTHTTAKGHNLYEETLEAGFQMINDPGAPTRNGTSVQRDTNPDLAFIKTATTPSNTTWRNTGETLGSDHCILEITIPLGAAKQEPRRQQHTDWQRYRKKLEENETNTIEDIEAWTGMLKATSKDATQEIETDLDSPMVDSRLAHLLEACNALKKRWKQQRHNRKLRKRIAQINREIEKHSAELCRQQWHAVCQEADGQLHKTRTWQLLRHLLNDQTTKGAQHYTLNRTIHKAIRELGEEEVRKRIDAKYLPKTPKDWLPNYEGEANELLDADIEEWEVRAVLQTINCKSAAGPDQVTNKALRNLNDTSIEALTKYYNKCWREGRIPTQWKEAKTVLIPKPGKPPHIDNLRPISLTSCVGKVLEHVLLNRWQRFLEEHNVYPDSMLGFRAKLCTQDAMLLLKREIIDNHQGTADNRAILGLDLQGAFDNVKHKAILQQVSRLNLGARTYAYIKDFLTDRTTKLVAGELQFPPKQLGSTGTPQGSVISPLLFNLVMIGVARKLETIGQVKHTIYADDITIWTTGGRDGDIEEALQAAVIAVEEHLKPTGLRCSPAKSELLIIPPPGTRKSNKEDSVIQVRTEDGPPIPRVPAIRVLGLHIQETQHNNVTVQKLQAKLTMATRLLRRVSTRHQGMREDSLLRLAQSFAISHVAYVAAFHNWKTNEKLKIDAMIRKTYKTALGLYAHTNTERMLALGIHNTLEEITEAQRTAQYHRLAQTKTGRVILHRIGLNTPATTPKEGTSLPETVARRLRIPPLPKHMHPQVHQERREARAKALAKWHSEDQHAYYVDVARYPNRANTYAAVAIAADTGEPRVACSMKCETVTQAEEGAIALALTIPNVSTILSDSKAAILNFASNNISKTTAATCQKTPLDGKVTIKWFPAHMGQLEAHPNRNEEADSAAHALTRRGLPSQSATDQPEDNEYSITSYGEILQWYRNSRRIYPAPHRDLSRQEAATLRQLQASAIWTPVLAKHICPEVYVTDTCQVCQAARASQRHILWGCEVSKQDGDMPDTLRHKIASQEMVHQRDAVQQVLGALARQRPKTLPSGDGGSRLPPQSA